MLPFVVKAAPARHLETVREPHQPDLRFGAGWVELPTALIRTFPNAGRDWPWQWVFAATRFYTEPQTRQRRRRHLHESFLSWRRSSFYRSAALQGCPGDGSPRPARTHRSARRPDVRSQNVGRSWNAAVSVSKTMIEGYSIKRAHSYGEARNAIDAAAIGLTSFGGMSCTQTRRSRTYGREPYLRTSGLWS